MMVLAAMGLSAGIYAQDAKADPAKDLMKADANKDGKVLIAEYIAFFKVDEAAAKKLDKNADGAISQDEVAAPAAK